MGDFLISSIISELLPSTTGSTDESDLSGQFVAAVKKYFGIDEALLLGISAKKTNTAEEYISNTRKPYVDNQLSEYSAFPTLIRYKNDGYGSCAMLPVVGNGRVLSIVCLLSKEEGKFTDAMVKALEIVVAFFAFSFAYKSEASKNSRLVEYFDAAFDSHVPQLLVSRDGSIIKANKSAMRAFGIMNSRTQSTGELFGFGFDDLRKAPFDSGVDLYFDSGGAYNIYRLASRAVNDNLLHVTAANVTGKAIMDSLLGSLSDSQDLYIVFTRDDFTIISSSANFETLMKYSNAMLSGKRFTDFMKENEAQGLANAAKESEGPLTLPLNLMTESFVMPVKAIVTKLAFGHMVTIITAEAENYVREAKENIGSFMESTSDIAMKVDSLGYIRECNLPVEAVLGYTKTELLGREARQLYKDASVLDRDIAYVRNGGKIDNSYIDLVKKDSDVVAGMQSVRLLRGSKDEEGYLVIIKELETKRRLADLDAELKEKDVQIKKAQSEAMQKSEFIYDITHELKTPLTNIKGFSTLLSDGQAGALNKEQKDYIGTIVDEADRLVLIIQQVLDAAKLEANKVKLETKDVDLRAMANSPAVKSLEESARQKGLSFAWSADYDLPTITADPNRLMQVFVNLIGNAIKFTENGGITVKIYKKSGNYIECDVVDTGIGISDEDKKKLFKKFYQAQRKDLALPSGAGTGLGLAIANSIVKLHAGERARINVESKAGEGSKFWFLLPIRKKAKQKRAV